MKNNIEKKRIISNKEKSFIILGGILGFFILILSIYFFRKYIKNNENLTKQETEEIQKILFMNTKNNLIEIIKYDKFVENKNLVNSKKNEKNFLNTYNIKKWEDCIYSYVNFYFYDKGMEFMPKEYIKNFEYQGGISKNIEEKIEYFFIEDSLNQISFIDTNQNSINLNLVLCFNYKAKSFRTTHEILTEYNKNKTKFDKITKKIINQKTNSSK